MPDNYRRWLKRRYRWRTAAHKKAARQRRNGTTLVIAVVVGKDVHIANGRQPAIDHASGMRSGSRTINRWCRLVDTAITPDQAAEHPAAI
jgi:hypothetical protein